VSVLIGPEGGLEVEEVEMAQEAGFQVVSMGRRILRAETAALAALAVIMYETGELGP
jgi:16S rRNA (uracil1498-N3)-methyltransferase